MLHKATEYSTNCTYLLVATSSYWEMNKTNQRHTSSSLHIFYCACAKWPYFYFLSKIWSHRRVSLPRFHIISLNFGDTWTFEADIAFFIFALIFRTSGPKMAIFRGKIGEGVGRYWPPTNSFLLLGVYTSVSNLVKIDKEMRPWEWRHTDRQTDRQTDRHTDTQTDANRFYYLSHSYML